MNAPGSLCTPSPAVAGALDRLVERLGRAGPLLEPFDAGWRSECEVEPPDAEGLVRWRPVLRRPAADFSGLDAALAVSVHPDVQAFYGRYWSACIPVRASEGDALLIQVWNEADFERLLANLIGHALAKSRARLPLTCFVACTDEGDLTLSVDNETGEVVLENPGEAPLRTVAGNLAELLDRLEPSATPGGGAAFVPR